MVNVQECGLIVLLAQNEEYLKGKYLLEKFAQHFSSVLIQQCPADPGFSRDSRRECNAELLGPPLSGRSCLPVYTEC